LNKYSNANLTALFDSFKNGKLNHTAIWKCGQCLPHSLNTSRL